MTNNSSQTQQEQQQAQEPSKNLTPVLDLSKAQQLLSYETQINKALVNIDAKDTLEVGNVAVTTTNQKDFQISAEVSTPNTTNAVTVSFTLTSREILELAVATPEKIEKYIEQKFLEAVKKISSDTTPQAPQTPEIPQSPNESESQPPQAQSQPPSQPSQATPEKVRAERTLTKFKEYFSNSSDVILKLNSLFEQGEYNTVWYLTDTALAATIERGQLSQEQAVFLLNKYFDGNLTLDNYLQDIAVTASETVAYAKPQPSSPTEVQRHS
jgi:hypothetical protein